MNKMIDWQGFGKVVIWSEGLFDKASALWMWKKHSWKTLQTSSVALTSAYREPQVSESTCLSFNKWIPSGEVNEKDEQ